MGLTNSQYESIMRRYSERQSENNAIQTMRRNEIQSKIPQISEIDRKIGDLSMEYALFALDNTSASVTSIRDLNNIIKQLSSQKRDLLCQHGYPANYLDAVYQCPDCQDTGFIDGDKCHCFKKAVTDLFYSRSNAKNIRKDETFATFSLEKYSRTVTDDKLGKSSYEHMKDVLGITKDYVKNFGRADSVKNLLFYGDTGLGKTFLSNCIANELIGSCYSVIYLTAIEFFNTLSKAEFNKDSDGDDALQEITDCDLLIIDDLGTELSNNFTNSRLFYCINDRILKDKATIISTNFSLEKLYDQYSDRIFSRIAYSYKKIKFFGNNIRLLSRKTAN